MEEKQTEKEQKEKKAERVWTSEQLAAINTRDKSLLVSAAAGSGKTATLTERIIRSIIDEGIPINRILVVTFTNAAVGELRERIAKAITEAIASSPENKNLEKQLLLLPTAKIMTIDSFCNDCLKSYPDAAGISPGYRIADDAEIMLAAKDIFEGITESIMRDEISEISPEEYDALTDCLVDTKRMADVFDVFRSVYTKLRATKDGADGIRALADAYDPERFTTPDETVFGAYIVQHERDVLRYRAALLENLAEELSCEGELGLKYADCARKNAEVYTHVANSESYAAMKAALDTMKTVQLPRARTEEKTPLMLLFKKEKDREKRQLDEEKLKFFSYTVDEWKSAYKEIYKLMNTFAKVLILFDRALDDHKRKVGTFDYTDIERLAFSALVKNGEPTETAKALRDEFLAVYIDEYQDVNDLQDSIFNAVCRPDNKFCVGDIKQSIYAFRSANPDIFANAKKSLPTLEKAEGSPAASLFMSMNFRSSLGVIDFVNSVFDKMFGAHSESIGYRSEDRLSPGREAKGDSWTATPEVCIAPSGEIAYSISEDEIEEDESEDVGPAVVAAKIRQILDTGRREDGKPVQPKDIAVVLRSMRGRGELYTRALEREGIPTRTSGKKSFFLNSDVLLALCLFNAIYNPLRDVYLAGLLRSPIFEFSADELAAIRKYKRTGPFYRALVSFVDEHPEYTKGKAFLERLAKWREIAEGMRTDKLIRRLFRETGLLALASERGEKDNLLRFYEYARSFEGSSFGGLGSFISYVNNVIAEGEKFDCNVESADEDAVTVISAHSSKGLEYPIVILADAGKRIQCPEAKEKLLVLPAFGAALRHRTPLGLALVDNPMINAVAEKMKLLGYEEELRILYVALTRARERLYVVGSYSEKTRDEYLDRTHLSSLCLSKASYKVLRSHLDIILAATGKDPVSLEKFIPEAHDVLDMIAKIESDRSDLGIESRQSNDEKLDTGSPCESDETERDSDAAITVDQAEKDELVRRFTYKYHSPHLTELPEKLSVSELYPTVLDGTENHEAEVILSREEAGKDGMRTVPEFISPKKETESKRRGIATHVFMQFCDLHKLLENGAVSELARLSERGYFTEKEAKRVRLDEIEAFRSSELFKRMLRAKKMWRELRFNTVLPASHFTGETERLESVSGRGILVQGVIDCILENPDGSLSIIDYKTDRLTREELSDKVLAEEKLRRAHRKQLGYYALATKEMFGKEPATVEVYSLALGECVDVKSP